jgi:hypothetical protein
LPRLEKETDRSVADDLISANKNSAMDAKFRANDWGDAYSKPDRIYDSLCNI